MKEIILDGKLIQVMTQTIDSLSEESIEGNIEGNIEKSKDIYSPYYIFLKNEDGSYNTNPIGIIPTIFEVNDDFTEIELLQITPLSEMPNTAFNELTISQDYPNGISFNELFDNIKIFCRNSYQWIIEPLDEKILTSPLSIKILEFSLHTGLSPDFASNIDFWGVMTHPLTHEQILVINQWGFYRNYVLNFFNGSLSINQGLLV